MRQPPWAAPTNGARVTTVANASRAQLAGPQLAGPQRWRLAASRSRSSWG